LKELHVIFGFDMETDIGRWTTDYRGILEGTPRILDVFNQNGIQASFLFTAISAMKHPQIVKRIKTEGHEIGCHTYQHNIWGKQLYDVPDYMCVRPYEMKARLKEATELITSISGERPVSFRTPCLFGSTELIVALDELSYKIDASYPVYYFEKHLLPYHPSRKDWREEGNLKILEIPNFADITLPSKDKYKRDRDQWPRFRLNGADDVKKCVDNVIELQIEKDQPSVICFYMHPWEFVEMPKTIDSSEARIEIAEFLWKNCGIPAVQELDKLIKLLKADGAIFHTMKEFASVWEKIKA